jgi:hypothetical protein
LSNAPDKEFAVELYVPLTPVLYRLESEFPAEDNDKSKPSLLQLPPKNEHKTRPNNRIKKRNNASVFIV